MAVMNTGTVSTGIALEITGLRKRYGEKLAVDDLSLRVYEGEIFGILGQNGAGKTTTVECAEGLRRPDGGTVRVFGIDPYRDRAEARRLIGVQLQESQLPDRITVAEAIELYASFYDKPADTEALIERLGLTEKRAARYRKLSGGQKQRLSIALALVGRPRLVVFDELTTGLDPAARRESWKLVEELRADGVTVLLVTHYADEAERLCDRVALIQAGRVAACGRPDELIQASSASQIRASRATLDDAIVALTMTSGGSPGLQAGEESGAARSVADVLQHHWYPVSRLAKASSPLKVVWSWPEVDLAALNPATVIVARESDGRWYVTFTAETEDPEPLPATGRATGVDLGVKDFAALSDGTKIANPRHLERKARNLARYQRRLARRQKGSSNRAEAKAKVARAYRKVADARRDFLHKASTRLVREHDLIAIEDLNVAGMTRRPKPEPDGNGGHQRNGAAAKAGLNKAVLDAGPGEFRRQLAYKGERTGARWQSLTAGSPAAKRARRAGTCSESCPFRRGTGRAPPAAPGTTGTSTPRRTSLPLVKRQPAPVGAMPAEPT
jgi:ABC-2 type transport system ATP-binding protein